MSEIIIHNHKIITNHMGYRVDTYLTIHRDTHILLDLVFYMTY